MLCTFHCPPVSEFLLSTYHEFSTILIAKLTEDVFLPLMKLQLNWWWWGGGRGRETSWDMTSHAQGERRHGRGEEEGPDSFLPSIRSPVTQHSSDQMRLLCLSLSLGIHTGQWPTDSHGPDLGGTWQTIDIG